MTQPGSVRQEFENDIVEENAHAIEQLIDLLERLPENAYQQSFGSRKQHVIGKHVRHIIDHYSSLLAATASPCGVLDYESRKREQTLETSRRVGADRLSDILRTLRHRFGTPYFSELAMLHTSANQEQTVATSVDRELAFLASHTIHHMAIIGMLAEEAGVEIGAEFGVHPSTLRFQHRQTSTMVRSA